MRQLRIIPDKCTGCMQCELACSWVQTGTFQPSRSVIRVNVFDEEASYAPYTCVQCAEAWCMNACPVNAIAVDPPSTRENRCAIPTARLGAPPVRESSVFSPTSCARVCICAGSSVNPQ